MDIGRRDFTAGLAASLSLGGVGSAFGQGKRLYRGPNVILVRFGGGVRRLETIDPKGTYAPYFLNTLVPRGTFIPDMHISEIKGQDTSHAEGTVNILTGRYMSYTHVDGPGISKYLQPQTPSLFEMIRKTYALAPHEVLLINGEDRLQEEYLTHGVHSHYGALYRSEALSLYRYKMFLAKQRLAKGGTYAQVKDAKAALQKLTQQYPGEIHSQSREIEKFWRKWQKQYGGSGLKNPRGDRLLTELALKAMQQLRPKFMMINYQDPDYVHWGNISHYTRAISVIDEGLKQLVSFTDNDEFYRGRTVYVIVPDCGRDSNPMMGVPFQHHFNTRSAHEIWALLFGAGIARNVVLKRERQQVDIAPTVASIMGLSMRQAEGDLISGALL